MKAIVAHFIVEYPVIKIWVWQWRDASQTVVAAAFKFLSLSLSLCKTKKLVDPQISLYLATVLEGIIKN